MFLVKDFAGNGLPRPLQKEVIPKEETPTSHFIPAFDEFTQRLIKV
jgi:hypothetical protein